MDFHVITPTEDQLVMRTSSWGSIDFVLPAPASSLPPAADPVLLTCTDPM